eukprot:2803528-Rhodomonas_salina.1
MCIRDRTVQSEGAVHVDDSAWAMPTCKLGPCPRELGHTHVRPPRFQALEKRFAPLISMAEAITGTPPPPLPLHALSTVRALPSTTFLRCTSATSRTRRLAQSRSGHSYHIPGCGTDLGTAAPVSANARWYR